MYLSTSHQVTKVLYIHPSISYKANTVQYKLPSTAYPPESVTKCCPPSQLPRTDIPILVTRYMTVCAYSSIKYTPVLVTGSTHLSSSHQLRKTRHQSPGTYTRVPFPESPCAMGPPREEGVPERHMLVSYLHPIANCPKQLALARSVYRRPSSFPPGFTPTQHAPSACKLLLWSIFRAQGQPLRERGTSFGILSACENFPGA